MNMDRGQPLYPTTNTSQTMMKEQEPQQASMAQVQQTTSTVPLLLGPVGTVTKCPFCVSSIKTGVKYTKTSRTYINASLWGLCCLCCLHCNDSARNVDHYCPNCERYLGTYEK